METGWITVAGGGETALVLFDGEYIHTIALDNRTGKISEQSIHYESVSVPMIELANMYAAETM